MATPDRRVWSGPPGARANRATPDRSQSTTCGHHQGDGSATPPEHWDGSLSPAVPPTPAGSYSATSHWPRLLRSHRPTHTPVLLTPPTVAASAHPSTARAIGISAQSAV